MSRIRNYFLTGLVLVARLTSPQTLTWWFINWVDDLVRPLIPATYRPETYLPVHVPGTGLIIAFLALTVLGFLTAIWSDARWSSSARTSSTACRWCGRSTRASSRYSRRCSRIPGRASVVSG